MGKKKEKTAEEAVQNPAEQPLSPQRKTAMLRYMAVLFAVAFLLVAVSLAIQMRNSRSEISQLNQTSSSALQNAEKLQNQNRELQNDRVELLAEKAELQKALTQARSDYAGLDALLQTVKSDLAASEKAAADQQAQLEQQKQELAQETERTKEAYDALVFVLSCQQPEGNVTYLRAMETLKTLKKYLSDDALAAYEALLQP